MADSVAVGWAERSGAQHRVPTWVKAVLKSAITLILIEGVLGCSEGIMHQPYNCYNTSYTQKTDEEISACMNNKFPTPQEVFEYFNNSTFVLEHSKNNYSVVYYNPDGQYREIQFSDSPVWGSISTDQGSWKVYESILSLHSTNETKTAKVADFCEHSIFQALPVSTEGDDGDDLIKNSICDTIWDLKNKKNHTAFPLDGWKRMGTGDIYGISRISNESGLKIEFNVTDYIKNANPDMPPSIEEVIQLIYVNQHELEVKRRDSENHNSPLSIQ